MKNIMFKNAIVARKNGEIENMYDSILTAAESVINEFDKFIDVGTLSQVIVKLTAAMDYDFPAYDLRWSKENITEETIKEFQKNQTRRLQVHNTTNNSKPEVVKTLNDNKTKINTDDICDGQLSFFEEVKTEVAENKECDVREPMCSHNELRENEDAVSDERFDIGSIDIIPAKEKLNTSMRNSTRAVCKDREKPKNISLLSSIITNQNAINPTIPIKLSNQSLRTKEHLNLNLAFEIVGNDRILLINGKRTILRFKPDGFIYNNKTFKKIDYHTDKLFRYIKKTKQLTIKLSENGIDSIYLEVQVLTLFGKAFVDINSRCFYKIQDNKGFEVENISRGFRPGSRSKSKKVSN